MPDVSKLADEDLAAIKARVDSFRMGSVRDGLHELALRAAKSAEDVPTLIEEVERLRSELARYRRMGWAVTVEWHGPDGLERQQYLVRELPGTPWAGQVEAVEVFVLDGDS